MNPPPALAGALSAALGYPVASAPGPAVHGGSINRCWCWPTAQGPVFVKLAAGDTPADFNAERHGLELLARSGAVRVPRPLAVAACAAGSFLVLEWMDLRDPAPVDEARFGEAVAALHRCRESSYGLEQDNLIGATVQPNGWLDDWVAFFRERRLQHQLGLAAGLGHGGRLQARGERLVEVMHVFFSSYRPTPSLLHGDLWSGNRAVDVAGVPVLFDPACYFGDREADLAMTHLFGGFGPRFYAAYVAAWPLDAAAGTRRDLYNLYHVLNHLNLFGGSYRAQAEAMIDRLLAAAGH
ncbi:MAG: fructosamine kinase family protein [Steroidobacteraceae bacterium]